VYRRTSTSWEQQVCYRHKEPIYLSVAGQRRPSSLTICSPTAPPIFTVDCSWWPSRADMRDSQSELPADTTCQCHLNFYTPHWTGPKFIKILKLNKIDLANEKIGYNRKSQYKWVIHTWNLKFVLWIRALDCHFMWLVYYLELL